MKNPNPQKFSNKKWLESNAFEALAEIAKLVQSNENVGRECLIRLLEHRDKLLHYNDIINDLIQRVGLYPYLHDYQNTLSTSDLINIERHVPIGMNGIILHSMQGKVYNALLDGANVILSAPTSFGKSLLIDAVIASEKHRNIVVIVPTIALIDETRRRLSRKFQGIYKIITHASQTEESRNIYIFTQERFIEHANILTPDFFVIDEFYKLSPDRSDERTFVLNHAFYKLHKSGAQFFLIGPNVHNIALGENKLSFRYIDTNFSTVVADIRHISNSDVKSEALKIASTLETPTLIFCKSSHSAYDLGRFLIENAVQNPNETAQQFAEWISENYHPDWELVELIKNGFAVHHGALPRAVAYHILRLFNAGIIKFLLCTSTIIEGVNTAAENIIIYDNKIATSKFDLFTFNNIKGRAGRMFKHFVGNVFVLNYQVQQELPFVDIPAITQPENTPESLLIHIEDEELSEISQEKIQHLYEQNFLSMDIIRSNSDINPDAQVRLAEEIAQNIHNYSHFLNWRQYPKKEQRQVACQLIFDYLMEGKGRDGIFTSKQMNFKLAQFCKLKYLHNMISAESQNKQVASMTDAVENVLIFLRRWGEHHFPKYFLALDKIQRFVFTKHRIHPGDYEFFASELRKWFLPISATALEEYGIPFQITLKLETEHPLGDSIDDILKSIRERNFQNVPLNSFEYELLIESRENI